MAAEQPIPLTRIAGIGSKTEAALHQIGIVDAADLAGLSPNQLADRLSREADLKVSARRIEADDWIGQARKVADAADAAELEPTAAPGATIRNDPDSPDEPDTGGRAAGRAVAMSDEGRAYVCTLSFRQEAGQPWRAFLYDDELGRDEEIDVDPRTWSTRIAERAGLPVPSELTLGENVVEVEGDDLRVSTDLDVNGVPEETPLISIVAFVDRTSGEFRAVDVKYGKVRERLEATRHNLPIPDTGSYDLESLVLLDCTPPVVGRRAGPALTVVP